MTCSSLLPRLDLVFFDLKLIDPQRFHQYTGGDIQVVLLNLDRLRQSAVPVVIRLPLVPGVTDTAENIQAVLELSGSLPNLIRLELLPYNRLAGAKYPAAGMPFNPGFDENLPPQVPTHILETSGVPWRLA